MIVVASLNRLLADTLSIGAQMTVGIVIMLVSLAFIVQAVRKGRR